jgi:general stress protein 26
MTSHDIWKRIESERVCMMATMDDDVIRSRPMGPIARMDEGRIWFMTHRTSGKMGDLADDTPVTLTFQNSGGNWCVTISGSASVVDSRAKAKELWSAAYKQWFDGPEDPDLVLIAFESVEADYWNGPNALVVAAKMAVAAATGIRTDMGDHGKVSM